MEVFWIAGLIMAHIRLGAWLWHVGVLRFVSELQPRSGPHTSSPSQAVVSR